MTTKRFFVYGSLCEGFTHFSRIENFVENQEVATVVASAYRLHVGYPALVKGGNDRISGQLFDLKTTELSLALMDEFFGFNRLDPDRGLYFRELADVQISGQGESVKAWIYYLNPLKLPLNAQLIKGGDWVESLRHNPSLLETLGERKTTYLKRLGQSTGREIVPIDLTLYRELINLELVVDKGRRLALSKLGQEVYRHLV